MWGSSPLRSGRRGELPRCSLTRFRRTISCRRYYYIGLTQAGQNGPAWKETLNTYLSFKAKGDEQGLVADARRRLQER